MEYTVDITLNSERRLTERALFAIAELGGVSVGAPGGRRAETTLTITAANVPRGGNAGDRAHHGPRALATWWWWT